MTSNGRGGPTSRSRSGCPGVLGATIRRDEDDIDRLLMVRDRGRAGNAAVAILDDV